jgi:tetratricopeptide (TPR) repeat protein
VSEAQAGARASKAVDLAQVSVPRLVFALLHQRFTGVLQLEQPGQAAAPRTVWVQGGMPVFTDWIEPTDMLGQILVSQGLLGDADLYAALAQADAGNHRLGQVLVAHGRITPPQLSDALRKQCARKLAHLFALRTGRVDVIADPHEVGNGDGLEKLNVLELIQAAVGLYYDEARVATEMGAALTAPVRATAALKKYISHFRFRPADEDILRALTDGTDLARLEAMPGVTRRRAAQLIYTLWACQMLHVGAAATTTEAAQPTPPPASARPRTSTAPMVSHAPRPPAEPSAPPQPPVDARDADAPVAPRGRPGTMPESGESRRPRAQTQADLGTPTQAESAEHTPAHDAESFASELQRLEALVEKNAHAFELFALPLDATKKQVRHAWGDLSRIFHPDALQSRGLGHLRERVSTVFAALSEAHRVLGDAQEREKLAEQVKAGDYGKPKSDETARVRAAFEAEMLAKDGDKLLRNNRFDRALERFREAAELDPEEPDIQAAIVWCEFQVSAKSTDDHVLANGKLGEILQAFPNIARAYYFRGFVLAGLGHDPLAIEAFSRALALDPRLIDAERQARALRMKRSSPSPAASKKTGLRGFFGGKK